LCIVTSKESGKTSHNRLEHYLLHQCPPSSRRMGLFPTWPEFNLVCDASTEDAMSDLNRVDDLRFGVNGDEKLPANREERSSAASHRLKRY